MLHSAIHWPDVADPILWPLAFKHAVFLVNHMPDPRTGLSPHDVFTKTRWEQKKLMDVHVWGCPVYVLDKMISDGKKLPRWTPGSTRTVNLGFSNKHANSVPLVLNPQTGYITPQFHIVFNDWFATVPASADDLPNFNNECWQRMFQDSTTYQYVLDDEDEERLIVDATYYEQAQDLLCQMQRVASAIDASTPPQILTVAPPPLSTPWQPLREQIAAPIPAVASPPPSTPLLTPREATPQPLVPVEARLPTPKPTKLFQSPPTPIQPVVTRK